MKGELMREEWRDIKDYEGLYMVSNLGRVKSISFRNNKTSFKREKLLSLCTKDNDYLYITLTKEGKRQNYYIHRLVANAFICNPLNLSEVNHKDSNRQNNIVSNLEWVSRKGNMEHASANFRLNKRKSTSITNTGERYITYRKSSGRYRVIIDRKEYSRSTLEEAIKLRDTILERLEV